MPILLLLLLLLPGMAAAAGIPAPVARALEVAGVPAGSVGIYVRQVDRPRPLLAHGADQALNPASTMKLVTTYAGLELLGPAYAWTTEIHATGPVREGVLDGDLVLRGNGDPALTLPRFWELLRTLRQTGLREIRGDLVLDQGYFEPSPLQPGAFDGEPWRAYNAEPEALMVNFKATDFGFRVLQGRVLVTADPDMPQLAVVNRIKLEPGPCGAWKERLGYRVAQAPGAPGSALPQVTITFEGRYAEACGERTLNLVLFDGSSYLYQLFRQLWREQGGSIAGNLRSAPLPADARLILQVRSPPLAEVVRMINKHSNNVMARQLLLSIAAAHAGPPGSAAAASMAIGQWLRGKGLDFPELVLENGAGLSRLERISARHLGELLVSAWNSPAMPELMSSLPIAALDGTLEKRFRDSALAGSAHIKTGSLDAVRSHAGYLLDRKGRRWVVVFVVNDARAGAARPAQDALLEWLYARE